MGLHHVTIHIVITHPSRVPGMIMVQCLEATGIKCFFSTCKFFETLSLLNDFVFLSFFSDRDSYGGGREPRGYMERTTGGSYREPYDGYGKIPNLCFRKELKDVLEQRPGTRWPHVNPSSQGYLQSCLSTKVVQFQNRSTRNPS